MKRIFFYCFVMICCFTCCDLQNSNQIDNRNLFSISMSFALHNPPKGIVPRDIYIYDVDITTAGLLTFYGLCDTVIGVYKCQLSTDELDTLKKGLNNIDWDQLKKDKASYIMDQELFAIVFHPTNDSTIAIGDNFECTHLTSSPSFKELVDSILDIMHKKDYVFLSKSREDSQGKHIVFEARKVIEDISVPMIAPCEDTVKEYSD